ncbi:MAG: GNAT family N-acetyltransferase [Pseudomonadota bacterium]
MTQCRNATLAELEQVLGWAAEEGWNPGLDDAQAFYGADPNGFFVAVDQADTPIASISVVNHTADFAFLGLYIVKPEFRGQGIGLSLWTHALRYAGSRTIGLDGVEAQQANYRVSGFVSASGTTRFTGGLDGQRQADVREAAPHDVPQLIEMEGRASGVVKPDYLAEWFSQSPKRSTIILDTSRQIDGFATIRACRSGAKVGPIVASDADTASRLIAHAATLFDGPLTIDVPDAAKGLTHLCQQMGFEPGFRTARMYRGAPPISQANVFAVTSLELG